MFLKSRLKCCLFSGGGHGRSFQKGESDASAPRPGPTGIRCLSLEVTFLRESAHYATCRRASSLEASRISFSAYNVIASMGSVIISIKTRESLERWLSS